MTANHRTQLNCRPYAMTELPHEAGFLMGTAYFPGETSVGQTIYLDHVDNIRAAASAKLNEWQARFPGYHFSFSAETDAERPSLDAVSCGGGQ